ncbi:MAG: DNA polymerase III subunit delta [Chloroflexi bacterium]|nr:DNA polymerase III subunit delta [Chloroflexota bacterium]
MIYILHGADDFSRDERLAEIKAGLGPKEALDLNTVTLDGGGLALQDLTNACCAMPFLGQKRLVVVEGLLGRFESPRRGARRLNQPAAGAEKLEKEWGPLRSFLGIIPLTTELVFVDSPLSRSNPIFRGIASLATAQEFPLLRGERLNAWIQAGAQGMGLALGPGVVRLLAILIGGNLRLMREELAKLQAYAAGRPVRQEDVRLLSATAKESSIFSLVDAVIEGQPAKALRLVQQLQEQGEKVPGMLVMLTRQVRTLLLARELMAKGIDQDEMAARLGLANAYAFEKALEQAKRYRSERLRAFYRKLLDADLSIKTGRLDEGLALDLLVAELAGV